MPPVRGQTVFAFELAERKMCRECDLAVDRYSVKRAAYARRAPDHARGYPVARFINVSALASSHYTNAKGDEVTEEIRRLKNELARSNCARRKPVGVHGWSSF